MDLQVFAQEFLREHLAMKFSWNLLESLFQSKDVTVGRFSKNSPLVIDYNVCVIDYTIII